MKTTWIIFFVLGILAIAKFLGQTPKPLIVSQNLKIAATLGVSENKRQQVMASFGKLPLRFEANQGQTDDHVKFLCRGRGYGLFLTSTEVVVSVIKAERESKGKRERARLDRATQQEITTGVLRMRLVGANRTPEIFGLEELPGRSNYFNGSDPSKWQTDVPNYAAVRYKDVYPGIDLIYYGNHEEVEYDWSVAPGANPKLIKLAIEGAEKISLDAHDDLLIELDGSEMHLHKPVVYQVQEAEQQPGNNQNDREYARVKGANLKHFVQGNYVVNGPHTVAFEIAAYDSSRPLIIDPVLSYSSFLGGNGEDEANAIAIDSTGNAYIAGSTVSSNFPTKNPLQASFHGNQDAFVAKFNPATSGAASLVYSTYLGSSSGNAFGLGIAVDSAGNAYVTGGTGSTNFPTTPGAFQTVAGSPGDAFVTKLDPTGSALVYSTYVGGSGNNEQGLGIVVDSAGDAYVTGFTDSLNFPTKNAFQASLGGGLVDAFVTKLNPAGSALLYSTYLGGSSNEQGTSIAVDSSGNAYVTGNTGSINFPTTVGAFQTNVSGVGDAFVAKINPAVSGTASVIYSTYLGGSASDEGFGIAVDSTGDAYVTGLTFSTDFPTTPGAFQRTLNGNEDAFVTKLNATGSTLVFSTLLGGSSFDQGNTVALDSAANVLVAGETSSTNFPVTADAFRSSSQGANDAFVTKLNSGGSSLVFSTYLGGTNLNIAKGIAVDVTGNTYVTGFTRSSDFPTSNPFQPACASCLSGLGSTDAFVSKIANMGPPPDFSLTPASASLTAQRGGQVTDVITIAPQNGPFGSPIQLTCAVNGSSPLASCALSSSSVTPGANSVTSTLTITAPGLSAGLTPSSKSQPSGMLCAVFVFPLPGLALIGFGLACGKSRERRRRLWLMCSLFIAFVALQTGCGGGSQQPPPLNYTVTVTGTSVAIQHATNVMVTVP